MPETMDAMGPTEANMAGQRLLPSLDPFDWPGPRQIHAAQQDIPGPARRTLRSIDTAEPDIALWVNTDGKIVLPKTAVQLIAAICAAAHQGKHGHMKQKVVCERISKAFWWPGMNADIK